MEYMHNLECDWCEGTIKKGKRFWKIEFEGNDGEDPQTGNYHETCARINSIGRRGNFERILYKEVNG